MTISLQPKPASVLRELADEHGGGKVSRAVAWLLETHPATCHKVREEVAVAGNG